ncbi:MAG: hypothetical protein ACYTEV_02145 [Planctomycetota bacterium]|jgi:hypothetical protein
MAVRSGAGTGVIVSLIVFIVLSIAMLVMSIVFYSRQTEAIADLETAQNDLAQYVKAAEKASDRFTQFEQAAGSRQSVAGYLATRYDDLASFVTGGESSEVDAIKSEMGSLGVDENAGIRGTLRQMQRDARDLQDQVGRLERTIDAREQELADRDRQIADMQAAHDQERAQLREEVAEYREANEAYAADLQATREMMEERVESQRADADRRIDDLNQELDIARTDLRRTRDRLEQYETLLEGQRIQADNPALLADGKVLDSEPASGTVFLDRGGSDRIVLGLSFEVFDSVDAIRIAPDGTIARGKASVKVTEVGESTSVAAVTRSTPGRPIVRGDVIVNAAYDPNRTFKFLVHGAFDVDRDGRATAEEAEFIKSQIINWGGTVVESNTVPGDLDFLVLGVQPDEPAPLATNASSTQIQIWAARKEARATYDQLMAQASDAKIPVLNQNRFFILIGSPN